MGRRPLISALASFSCLLFAGSLSAEPAATETAPASPSAASDPGAPSASAPVATAPAPAAAGVERNPELGLRAYEAGLAQRKLAPTAPLSAARLREERANVEQLTSGGRLGEAIAAAASIVESSRFAAFQESPEGRGMRFALGDALGRAGAYPTARAYLTPLVAGSDVEARRAARSLVDFGLESGDPAPFIEPLEPLAAKLPNELRGDLDYARGRAFEKAGRLPEALSALANVGPRSRFWAQSVYLSGLIEAERGNLKQAENLFCKVADAKLTPKEAPIFGGADFFEVRDLARLGLGRVAHESYRFDDAQYYYYLVPKDSAHLPEALYESATTRYEASDYEGAREYLDELAARSYPHTARRHPYEDERYILDAYVDLSTCHFEAAEKKLSQFHQKYDPVLSASRRLQSDPKALRRLLAALEAGSDPALANLGTSDDVARAMGALLRMDPGYAERERRLRLIERELDALDQVDRDLQKARALLAEGGKAKASALKPQVKSLTGSEGDQRRRFEAQLAELRRLLRDAQASGKVPKGELETLQRELSALELRAKSAELAPSAVALAAATDGGTDLASVLASDAAEQARLRRSAEAARVALSNEQGELAKAALARLTLRLERLVHRARLGRIETVLGKKRALEVEIEALSQGYLPKTLVDSLDVDRYLRDDEEYWPDDGEDWADEYVGGEGLQER